MEAHLICGEAEELTDDGAERGQSAIDLKSVRRYISN